MTTTNKLGHDWKKGDKVVKVLHGTDGYREAVLAEIAKIDKKSGVLYVSDGEGDYVIGITYDFNGNEIERFFLPMKSEITPIEPLRQQVKKVDAMALMLERAYSIIAEEGNPDGVFQGWLADYRALTEPL